MANPSKSKGTRWEGNVTDYFNEWVIGPGFKDSRDFVCERIVQKGNHDNGDLRLRVDDLTLTVEAKWREKYPPRCEELDFRTQTDKEVANAMTDGGILVVNRYRQGIGRAEAWMRFGLLSRLNGNDVEARDGDWCMMRLEELCRLCFGERRTWQ